MFQIDTSIPWHEHFVKYGFAVLRDQVDRAWAKQALERVRDHTIGVGRDLPFEQWTTRNVRLDDTKPVPGDPLLDSVYDQPKLRDIMTTLYGTPEVGAPTGWNGQRAYGIFLTPFDPDVKPVQLWGGHIDFGGNLIPLFGNAFVMQVALHDTEPHGGNITITPGSHKLVQKRAIDDRLTQYPYDFEDFPFTEPYEFVARAGDVLLMHHLSFHTGNPCCGATRRPRIALHCQVQRTTFLTRADPNDATNPPWVRSFTLNGFIEDPDDEQRYIRFCDAKKALWGVWTGDGGKTRYKIYTFFDGSLRITFREEGVPDRISMKARFDGRRLTFSESIPADYDKDTLVTPWPATTLELDPGDAEHLRIGVRAADGSESHRVLRRTEAVTTRQSV
ncbi:MAG: hypothetical protein K8S99_02155 [Planctomycetes bacterium]|nr:hypothetical protein [Planctomycetota bacterium]